MIRAMAHWHAGAWLAVVMMAGTSLAAADWPQFLGPERNGAYSGPPLSRTWPAGGPRVAWRRPVGLGFAGPVVASGRLILFHRVAGEEIVESVDAATGAPQWRFAYPTVYRDDFGFDEGPRAVPVVVNGRVYTFGAEGQLHAIELATGRKVWGIDTQKAFAPRLGFFGRAGSPLVEDWPRPRQHRRQLRRRRHHRVQRGHGCRALAGDQTRGELLVGGRRDD
jgi:hypothetical protein